jgi:hypothetical protein
MLDYISISGSSCDIDLDSRISCELTAENTCPTYCCQAEDNCYERKGNPFSWITLKFELFTLQICTTYTIWQISHNPYDFLLYRYLSYYKMLCLFLDDE